MRKLFGIAVSLIAVLCPGAMAEFDGNLVLINGKIYTVDEDNSVVQAVYIRKGRIAAVGSSEEVLRKATPGTQVVELQGRTVVPGFIDSHGHLMNLGLSMNNLDLTGTTNYQEILTMVADDVIKRKAGEWILGRGWDQNDWADTSIPHHYLMTIRSRENPVMLTRVDGHASMVNGVALEMAGITSETADPPGGMIVRDQTGAPTGVLIDRAMDLVTSIIPEPTEGMRVRAIRQAIKRCTSLGLTTVHDAGVSAQTVALYKDLIDKSQFPFRVYAMLSTHSFSPAGDIDAFLSEKPLIGYGSEQLTVRAVKVVADGALGSRGASLFEPYTDEPTSRGLEITDLATMTMIANRALVQGYQVATHAIGDLANNATLTAYAAALNQHKNKNHRFRIEHAQIMRMSDIEWMGKLGVIASIQAQHATSDMPWAESRIGGERLAGAYAWRKMLDNDVRITNGSDFPVESANPLWGFYASITRQDKNGIPQGGWRTDEVLTREEALRSFTIDGAYAAFEETSKGSIEVGKWADLAVLSKDIMTVAPADILKTRVLMTFIGGTAVYRANSN